MRGCRVVEECAWVLGAACARSIWGLTDCAVGRISAGSALLVGATDLVWVLCKEAAVWISTVICSCAVGGVFKADTRVVHTHG